MPLINTPTGHSLSGISDSDRTSNDVLCGTGSGPNEWPGNIYYRERVRAHSFEYHNTKTRTKRSVAEDVVAEIRALDPPGRFLKKNKVTKLWYDIGDKGDSGAIEKAGRLMRDMGKVKDDQKKKKTKLLPQTAPFFGGFSSTFNFMSTTATALKGNRGKSKKSDTSDKLIKIEDNILGMGSQKNNMFGGKRNKEHKKSEKSGCNGYAAFISLEKRSERNPNRHNNIYGDLSTVSSVTAPSTLNNDGNSIPPVTSSGVSLSDKPKTVDHNIRTTDDFFRNLENDESERLILPKLNVLGHYEGHVLSNSESSYSSAGSGRASKMLRIVDQEIGDKSIDKLIDNLDLDNEAF